MPFAGGWWISQKTPATGFLSLEWENAGPLESLTE
jgi:hypothetical protein